MKTMMAVLVAGALLAPISNAQSQTVSRSFSFRQGDGINASFTAKMFVSAADEDPNAPGIQNLWIQGVGCTEGTVHVR